MTNKHDTYVPSTTPGKSWKVYVHKGFDKRIYAAASEGVEGYESGCHSFTTVLGKDHFFRDYLTASRLTDKVEREGVAHMIQLLKDRGFA